MSTRTERGSAIVIVLSVLLVVSLLGAGLLLQSNLDTQFTRAAALYDHSFQLADGGVDIAVSKLFLDDPDRQLRKYNGNPLYRQVLKEDLKLGNSTWQTRPDPDRPSDPHSDNPALYRGAGTIAANNIMKGNDSVREAGWDAAKFYQQLWLSEGRGESGQAKYSYVAGADVARNISSNFVDAAVSRKGWAHYGDY